MKDILQQTKIEANAFMQLMAKNVTEVMSASSLSPDSRLCIDASPTRKPVATGPSKLVLISRSIHESCCPVPCSAPGNSKLVLWRQSIRRVEVRWFTVLDPRRAYVVYSFPSSLPDKNSYKAGSGKSVLWCAVSFVYFSGN